MMGSMLKGFTIFVMAALLGIFLAWARETLNSPSFYVSEVVAPQSKPNVQALVQQAMPKTEVV